MGSLARVEALLEKTGRHVDMGQFGYLLFDSVDQEQPDITTCLIKFGGNPDIWKKVVRMCFFAFSFHRHRRQSQSD